MPRAIPIKRPPPDADALKPRASVAFAGACFMIGLFTSAWILWPAAATREATNARSPEEPRANDIAVAKVDAAVATGSTDAAAPLVAHATNAARSIGDLVADAPGPTDTTITDEEAPTVAPTANAGAVGMPPTGPAVPPAPTRVESNAAAPAPSQGTPALRPTVVRIERGRIAYIRCDGIPHRTGPIPCPRDPAMERVVWSAIDALATSCPALASAHGSADVRVVFDGRRFSGLGFHPTTPPALAEVTRVCLEPRLAGVTQSLGASRLTASFRFDAH